MVFAIILMALLALSLFGNLSSFMSGLVFSKGGKHTRTVGPRLEEVVTEDNDASDKIAVIDVQGIITSHAFDSGGYGMLMGPFASKKEIEEYVGRMRKNPANYVAQPLVELSAHPTYVDGRFEPRRIDLRPFILYGETIRVLPGGLTRVALRPGSYVVNSSQGGGSKDTWVLAPKHA